MAMAGREAHAAAAAPLTPIMSFMIDLPKSSSLYRCPLIAVGQLLGAVAVADGCEVAAAAGGRTVSTKVPLELVLSLQSSSNDSTPLRAG